MVRIHIIGSVNLKRISFNIIIIWKTFHTSLQLLFPTILVNDPPRDQHIEKTE